MNKVECIDKIIYSEKEIKTCIKKIALELNKEYKNSKTVPIFLSIMNGALNFFVELIKNLDFPHLIDIIRIQSYFDQQTASNNIRIQNLLEFNLANLDVYIVDEIIESGNTLIALKQYVETFNPKSINIITLINKTSQNKTDLVLKYNGFELTENIFLIGFGLDLKEFYRSLSYIGSYNKNYNDQFEIDEYQKLKL